MLERKIEAHLVKRCKELRIICDKFTSPSRRSVPDRVLIYRGCVIFLELKATHEKPSTPQKRDHKRRWEAGAIALWTDSIEGVEVVLQRIGRLPIPYLATQDGGAPYKVDPRPVYGD